MKKLLIINGTMGVGKTTICKQLYESLENSVWLDGDWCWMMNPFNVTEENKLMVMDNITHLLRNFLLNSSYDYVIFCWVMHMESIIEDVLSRLKGMEGYEVCKLTLMCSEEKLRERIMKDVHEGLRDIEGVEPSIGRLKLYEEMNTIKIDTGSKSVNEVVEEIMNIVGYRMDTQEAAAGYSGAGN